MTISTSKFFIEIGSSDFDTLLPLSEEGWRGIIVEPVSDLLYNLKKNDNVIFENCAISNYIGTTTVKYYDPKWAKEWTRGVGSISSINNFNTNPQWKEHVREKTIPCMTLNKLLDKYKVEKINFLKIDTEGVEWLILDDYDWRILPEVLKIEHRHWRSHKIDADKYISLFKNMGYVVYEEENDIYAIR